MLSPEHEDIELYNSLTTKDLKVSRLRNRILRYIKEKNVHLYCVYTEGFLMMKVFNELRVNIAILLVIVFQLFNASCSRQIYTGSSVKNAGSPAENRRLKTFMNGGIEKKTDTHNTSPDEIIKTARKYLGVPHCMGGTTSKCMDCSGLLFTVFARYGISLPHSSEEQARYGRIITGMDKLIKGDLVFFVRSYKTRQFITHSGIYIGSNKFIHTSTTNGVTITSLFDPWWKEKFIFGTRVLE